jgi:hypothetical protein
MSEKKVPVPIRPTTDNSNNIPDIVITTATIVIPVGLFSITASNTLKNRYVSPLSLLSIFFVFSDISYESKERTNRWRTDGHKDICN